MRHNLVTTNISNAETPGYKSKDVNFEVVLRDALATETGIALVKTNEKHLEGGSSVDVLRSDPEVASARSAMATFDGNTVSIDTEMYKLNENSLLYQSETEVLARLFASLKFAVTEGGNP